MTEPLDPALLQRLLRYDPETGKLFWRERTADLFSSDAMYPAAVRCGAWNRRYAGEEAIKGAGSNGYLGGRIFDRNVLAHRVAFAILHGFWPIEVDHINGCRSDNRACNLRAVTILENRRNQKRRTKNSASPTGVYQAQDGAWIAQIGINYGTKYLGRYGSMSAAALAREKAEVEHGFHPNHGRRA